MSLGLLIQWQYDLVILKERGWLKISVKLISVNMEFL